MHYFKLTPIHDIIIGTEDSVILIGLIPLKSFWMDNIVYEPKGMQDASKILESCNIFQK